MNISGLNAYSPESSHALTKERPLISYSGSVGDNGAADGASEENESLDAASGMGPSTRRLGWRPAAF